MADIMWDREKLKRFKRSYLLAMKIKSPVDLKDVFSFDGHDFVLGYARYLIEHLETIFK